MLGRNLGNVARKMFFLLIVVHYSLVKKLVSDVPPSTFCLGYKDGIFFIARKIIIQ